MSARVNTLATVAWSMTARVDRQGLASKVLGRALVGSRFWFSFLVFGLPRAGRGQDTGEEKVKNRVRGERGSASGCSKREWPLLTSGVTVVSRVMKSLRDYRDAVPVSAPLRMVKWSRTEAFSYRQFLVSVAE